MNSGLATDAAVYLAMNLRNVGPGLAVLNAWTFYEGRSDLDGEQPDVGTFNRLTRDLYIAPNDTGFWQGTFRDPTDDAFSEAAKTISAREPFTVDILYTDAEGGQRVISRFTLIPVKDEAEGWIATVARHWNLDRVDPRSTQRNR